MNEDQVKHMVDRFLGWKLPNNFNPDAGISYTRPNYAPSVDATPSGTNLFDASQADAMVRYMIEGMPGEPVVTRPGWREYAALSIVEQAVRDLTGLSGEISGITTEKMKKLVSIPPLARPKQG